LPGKSRGSKVEVRGWVRTRRDSKAGISFVHVTDGSCQGPMQVVAPNTLGNYASEVLRSDGGRSLIARGTLVQSQGKGQSFEIQADDRRGDGLRRRPRDLPDPAEGAHAEFLREQSRTCGRAPTRSARSRACATRAMAIHRFFTSEGFFWVNTPIITASDAEGAGQMFRVSHARPGEPASDDHGSVDFQQGLLRQGGVPHRVGPAQRRGLLPGAVEGLHVRAHVPRRELEHHAPPRRVLDDRAGDRVRRSVDDADLAERFLKYDLPRGARRALDDLKFFERARRQQGRHRAAREVRRASFERIDYGEAIEMLQKRGEEEVRVRAEWGMDLQTEHERFLTEEHVQAARWWS
jgi:asparaginyl-tRNA synthetase